MADAVRGLLAILLTAGLAWGCDCTGRTGSGGNRDAGTDAEPADAGRRVPRSIVLQSSGGGAARSAGHRARLSIGAPQPMGTAEGTDASVVTGPNAARP